MSFYAVFRCFQLQPYGLYPGFGNSNGSGLCLVEELSWLIFGSTLSHPMAGLQASQDLLSHPAVEALRRGRHTEPSFVGKDQLLGLFAGRSVVRGPGDGFAMSTPGWRISLRSFCRGHVQVVVETRAVSGGCYHEIFPPLRH